MRLMISYIFEPWLPPIFSLFSRPAWGRAVAGVVGEKELERHLPRRPYILAVRGDDHPLRNGHRASGQEIGPSLNGDGTEEAGRSRLQSLDEAQHGDGDAETSRGVEHGCIFFHRDRTAVDG